MKIGRTLLIWKFLSHLRYCDFYGWKKGKGWVQQKGLFVTSETLSSKALFIHIWWSSPLSFFPYDNVWLSITTNSQNSELRECLCILYANVLPCACCISKGVPLREVIRGFEDSWIATVAGGSLLVNSWISDDHSVVVHHYSVGVESRETSSGKTTARTVTTRKTTWSKQGKSSSCVMRETTINYFSNEVHHRSFVSFQADKLPSKRCLSHSSDYILWRQCVTTKGKRQMKKAVEKAGKKNTCAYKNRISLSTIHYSLISLQILSALYLKGKKIPRSFSCSHFSLTFSWG